MRIGLIAMSGIRACAPELVELGFSLPGFVDRGKTIASLPSLGLLTLAALTPPHIDPANGRPHPYRSTPPRCPPYKPPARISSLRVP